MALAKNYSIDRVDFGTATSTPLGRGLVLNNEQVEIIRVTKLTGDTSGAVALSGVQRPNKIYLLPLTDNAAAPITSEPAVTAVAFTHTNNTNVALSGLGTWTSALLFVTGRSYKYA